MQKEKGGPDNPPEKKEEEEDLEDQAKLSTKKKILNNLKFILGGFKEHFNDGWNIIDGSFLVLSAIAAGFWIHIAVLH